eukprot:TRINITY_DN35843_c0_g1_i1.p1 TRINITY_DN35843_c0_g1~~TRINITY_DN35843_c0_g1_i1.p1  ORF type:complete len:209 (+),score=68.75 TRINITY_DN35843_c0_g1_i1:45-629(+)
MAKRFEFSWDKGGVVEWIGTQYGQRQWENPHDAGDVCVTACSLQAGGAAEFVDRVLTSQQLTTRDEPYSWVQIELPVAVHPTHYRLSQRKDAAAAGLLRSWALLVSCDGDEWRVLCQHTDDQSLSAESERRLTGAWEVDAPKEGYYPFFRVVLFEKGNSASTNALCASCFDVYGLVRHRMWPPEQAAGLGVAKP